MHDFSKTFQNNCQKFILLLAYFGLTNFLNHVEKRVEKLVVDYLFEDFIRESDEASINGLLALILRISDVIVELYYLFEQHEN